MKSLVEQIFAWADVQPDKMAVTDGKKSLTYGQLRNGILYASKVLANDYQLKKGDRLIIAANKQPSFASVYFACHLLGIITLPIGPDTNLNRFAHIYKKAQPSLVIGFQNDEIDCPMAEIDAFENPDYAGASYATMSSMDQVADIMFTTGTTGEPKGVQLTQRNIAAAARNINTFVQNRTDDIEMLALPISHSFGLGRMKCALSNGQSLVLLGSFVNMKRFFRYMEEYHVTGFGMVPASWEMIKKLSGAKLGEYKDQLHYIEIGSAPMPIEEKKTLLKMLPRTRICMHYGLTEASRSTFMEFHEEADRLDTIGKASPNMTIEIRDEHGEKVPDGSEGEICVAGDAVTIGYYELPEENKKSFWGKYFRTGDWGMRETDGHIRLLSRKKELINVGGKKVSPMEVEAVLLKLDAIKDCACVAMPDPDGILGEVVKAFVVTDELEKIEAASINRIIGAELESYKLPKVYEIIDAIPKTSSGKVQRLLLPKA